METEVGPALSVHRRGTARGATTHGQHASGNAAPRELGQGFAEPCLPRITVEIRRAALGGETSNRIPQRVCALHCMWVH